MDGEIFLVAEFRKPPRQTGSHVNGIYAQCAIIDQSKINVYVVMHN